MQPAGRRDRKIVIERFTAVQDDYGEEVRTWSTWCTPFAAVYGGSGREQREAAQEQASQTKTFEVLSSSKTRAVTPLDRVVFDGATWDITASDKVDRGLVRITATRAVA